MDRPWKRKFLGYTMTPQRETRIKVAENSVRRLKDKLREELRRGRGRNLGRLIKEDLTPLLRGWMNYFRLAEVKGIFEELDGWIRRKLRCVIWRQWKRTKARAKGLMKRGLDKGVEVSDERARALVELRGVAYERSVSEILL